MYDLFQRLPGTWAIVKQHTIQLIIKTRVCLSINTTVILELTKLVMLHLTIIVKKTLWYNQLDSAPTIYGWVRMFTSCIGISLYRQ